MELQIFKTFSVNTSFCIRITYNSNSTYVYIIIMCMSLGGAIVC